MVFKMARRFIFRRIYRLILFLTGLVFDALSGAGTLIIRVLDLNHLSNIIGRIDKLGWRIPAGHYELHTRSAPAGQFHELLRYQEIEKQGIQDFVANQYLTTVFNGIQSKLVALSGMLAMHRLCPARHDKRVFAGTPVMNIINAVKNTDLGGSAGFKKLDKVNPQPLAGSPYSQPDRP